MANEISEAVLTEAIKVDGPKRRIGHFRLVPFLAIAALLAMVFIPLLEALGRRVTGIGIPGASAWVQHLTLWLGLLGAYLATQRRRHLAVAITSFLKDTRVKPKLDLISDAGTVVVLLFLAWASFNLIQSQYESPEKVGGWLPVWLAQVAMPLAFAGMALHTFLQSATAWRARIISLCIVLMAAAVLVFVPENSLPILTVPGLAVLALLALLGMPLYAVLGGAGLLLFYTADIPIAAVPAETYRIVTQPVLPSIPLFALSGTVLAAGGAPRRLVRLLNAWTGWLPGGAAISTVFGCALFTAITGASGVTILALGGLLLPVLMAARLDKRFSIGLLTASGSVGLLFPPSLPVILYGIYGHVAIDRLFLAALIPGILLVVFLAAFSNYKGRGPGKSQTRFDLHEAVSATWAARGDLILPFVVLVGLFGGFITLVETAALTALWAILLETLFHRELDWRRALPKAMLESVVLVGALMAVLGLALGVVSYMVDEQIPMRATEWVVHTIHSKLLFLLILNGMLLLVGAMMDIFSAIVIVVPLIVPIGMAFGVDPVHLGIIFLANLELGYLTPPIGMNLFLSSLRFERPLIEIWRNVVPFLVTFAIWVLLITYLPFLSVGVMEFLTR